MDLGASHFNSNMNKFMARTRGPQTFAVDPLVTKWYSFGWSKPFYFSCFTRWRQRSFEWSSWWNEALKNLVHSLTPGRLFVDFFQACCLFWMLGSRLLRKSIFAHGRVTSYGVSSKNSILDGNPRDVSCLFSMLVWISALALSTLKGQILALTTQVHIILPISSLVSLWDLKVLPNPQQ